jgi:O-succinylbenzoic acid--CoA ligase
VDPRQPPSLDVIRTHVREQLPAYCAPRRLVVRHELPRTTLGKLKRAELIRLDR